MPDTDIRSAWNLINPSATPTISHDAALAFLHVLNNRHAGYRLPRTVPPSLRASFERNQIDYQLDRAPPAAAQRWGPTGDQETSTGRKAKFGDTYLSRLGVGGKSSYRPAGTDFSSASASSATTTTATAKTTEDWDQVRLKRQLADLEAKIAAVEGSQRSKSSPSASASASRREGSKPALVKRELEQLLEYKRKEKRDLDDGEGRSKAGADLKGLSEEIAAVREQVEGLEEHALRRTEALERLRAEVEEERRGR